LVDSINRQSDVATAPEPASLLLFGSSSSV